MENSRNQDALDYHKNGRPGKIQVVPTKPYSTQRDLSLAYSPGVAIPCLEIEKNAQDAYDYTAKGNLVAVISNGTAVLGLGDIGALAGKPVMEGKGLLFKIFADIDVFDIEVNENALVISGEKRFEGESSQGRWRVMQCAYGSFRRVVPLPEAVNADAAIASYKNGVLRVELPKTKPGKPKGITIKVE